MWRDKLISSVSQVLPIMMMMMINDVQDADISHYFRQKIRKVDPPPTIITWKIHWFQTASFFYRIIQYWINILFLWTTIAAQNRVWWTQVFQSWSLLKCSQLCFCFFPYLEPIRITGDWQYPILFFYWTDPYIWD